MMAQSHNCIYTNRHLLYFLIVAGILATLQFGCAHLSSEGSNDFVGIESQRSPDKGRDKVTLEISEGKVIRKEPLDLWQIISLARSCSNNSGAIFFARENTIWTDAPGKMCKSADSGITWNEVSIPVEGRFTLRTIEFASETEGWAIIEDFNVEQIPPRERKATALFTNNGGNTWRIIHEFQAVQITGLEITGSFGLLTGVEYLDAPQKQHIRSFILKLDNKGGWENISNRLMDAEIPSAAGAMAISPGPLKDLIIVMSNGKLVRTKDGIVWDEIAQLEPNNNAFRDMGLDWNANLWITDASSGREGTGSRLTVLPYAEPFERVVIKMLPGYFLYKTINLSPGEFIALTSDEFEDSLDRTKTKKLILTTDDGSIWRTIPNTSRFGEILSIAIRDTDSIIVLFEGGQIAVVERGRKQQNEEGV